MRKGEQTRAAILKCALDIASRTGIEGLSIGVLAERMQMSKSGVFAHFGSREELQIAALREYTREFEEEILFPGLAAPRGLPRLEALFEKWLQRCAREIASGCIYISGAVEYDDRPGPIREVLVDMVSTWQGILERAVRLSVEEGHLLVDTDPKQIVFEMYGLILSLHHDARFLRTAGSEKRAKTGFERLIREHKRSERGRAGKQLKAVV